MATKILDSFAAAGGSRNLRMWRIRYTTTSPHPSLVGTTPGTPLLATGMVIVPTDIDSPKASRPIILFAPKTQGLGSNCAPSKALELGKEEVSEVKRMVAALKKGYAVAITDYDGYTTNSAAHEYLVGHAIGHAVLDLGLAVKQGMANFTNIDVPGQKPLKLATDSMMLIWGYSEGGTAATWAGQLLSGYAPSLLPSIKGVAAGGIVSDMKAVAKLLDGNAASGLLLAAVWGFHVAYPTPYSQGGPYFDLNTNYKEDLLGNNNAAAYSLTPPSTNIAHAILHADECINQLGLDHAFKLMLWRNNGFHTITTLTTDPALRWEQLLTANTAGNITIPVPTYLYYGTVSTSLNADGTAKEGDVILPVDNFNGLMSRMCATQTKLRKTVIVSGSYLAVNHNTASDKAFDAVTSWIDDRFNGVPVTAVNSTVVNAAGDTLVTTSCNQ
jgi:hypothetical protein